MAARNADRLGVALRMNLELTVNEEPVGDLQFLCSATTDSLDAERSARVAEPSRTPYGAHDSSSAYRKEYVIAAGGMPNVSFLTLPPAFSITCQMSSGPCSLTTRTYSRTPSSRVSRPAETSTVALDAHEPLAAGQRRFADHRSALHVLEPSPQQIDEALLGVTGGLRPDIVKHVRPACQHVGAVLLLARPGMQARQPSRIARRPMSVRPPLTQLQGVTRSKSPSQAKQARSFRCLQASAT